MSEPPAGVPGGSVPAGAPAGSPAGGYANQAESAAVPATQAPPTELLAAPPRPSLPPGPSGVPGASPSGVGATLEERPELGAGAAFAGGLLLALILKRIAA